MTAADTDPNPTLAPAAHRRRIRAWAAGYRGTLLVALVAFGVYANTLGNELVYDDATQIAKNQFLTSPDQIENLFNSSVWEFQATPAKPVLSNYYRPLFLLPIAVVVWLFGVDPFALHLLAVSVHVGVCLLVLAVGRRALPSSAAALAAALLFAVHPIHTESVAWVSGLTDPICALFALAAWWFHTAGRAPSAAAGIEFRAAPGGRMTRWTRAAAGAGHDLAAAGSLLAALFSKETAAALLIVLLAHDVLLFGWREPLRRWRLWALYALASAGYLVARYYALGGLVPQVRERGVASVGAVLLNLPTLFFDYLRYALWPADLSAFHVFEPIAGWAEPRLWFGLAAVALVVFLAVIAWRRRAHGALLLLIAFVAFLLPVMAIRSVGDNVFAERYLYLPTISLSLAAGVALERWSRWRRLPALALLTITLAGGGWATMNRNRVWSDDVTLFRDTLEKSPKAFLIGINLGVALLDRNDLAGAVTELERSARDAPWVSKARTNLGVAYHRQSRYRRAGEQYREALRRDPEDVQALFNLAHVECELGRPTRGLALYARLGAIDPAYPGLAFNRAIARREAGNPAAARADLSALAQAAPTPAVLIELGRTAALMHDLPAARRAYSAALALAPGSAELRAIAARPEDTGLFDRSEAARLLGEAARFGEAGDLEAAAELAGYAARRNPAAALPYQYLANAAMLRGDAAAAVAALEQALAREPGNPIFRRNLEAARRQAR